MSHENRGLSSSTVSLDMQTEPRGSYRGSNEFIRKCVFTAFVAVILFFNCMKRNRNFIFVFYQKKMLHMDKIFETDSIQS